MQIWKYYLISLRAGLFSAQNFSFQEVNSMKCHQERRVCAHWTDNWNQEESSTQAREDPSGGLCYHQHTTAQHDIEENYNIFLWELWLKSKLKDSHTHVKKKWKKKIAFISCQMNTEERNDICLRLPWLAVEAFIMEKRIWNSTGIWTGETRSPSSSSFKRGVESHLDKIMKMDHDNLQKVLQWQASWQTKPRQEGGRTIIKQQSGWVA